MVKKWIFDSEQWWVRMYECVTVSLAAINISCYCIIQASLLSPACLISCILNLHGPIRFPNCNLTYLFWLISLSSWLSVCANKRSSCRSSDFRQADKPFNSFFPERNSSWKLHTLKLGLILIVFCTFLTFLHSPAAYHNDHSLHAGSR